MQPGRKYAANDKYRYGFNGKENDNEVKGEGNQQDYGMRIYDPRIAKFLSIDPLYFAFPWYSSYQFSGNNPISHVDLDGAEAAKPDKPGTKEKETKTITTNYVTHLPDETARIGCLDCKEEDYVTTVTTTWYWYSGNLNRAQGAGWYEKKNYDLITQDWENGQVLLKENSFFGSGYIEGNSFTGREWNGWQVDDNGYLTGRPRLQMLGGSGGLEWISGEGELKALKTGTELLEIGSLARKGEYVIYQGYKMTEEGDVLLYIGKAKNGIKARYSTAERFALQAKELEKLKKIPSNGVALGVEQLIMDLNGWSGKAANAAKPILANKIAATANEIYKIKGLKWLEKNVPNWKELYKFQ